MSVFLTHRHPLRRRLSPSGPNVEPRLRWLGHWKELSEVEGPRVSTVDMLPLL